MSLVPLYLYPLPLPPFFLLTARLPFFFLFLRTDLNGIGDFAYS